MDDLNRLASLVKQWNKLGAEIAAITQRPAIIGHVGEYIASRVFDLELPVSATTKGWDGRFRTGPLVGRTVNVKWYAKLEGVLDIRQDSLPEFFLVLTGPRSLAASSRGMTRPWLINHVFLFEASLLVQALAERGLKIGVATSVRREYWHAAEVYPEVQCPYYRLSDEQRVLLDLFRTEIEPPAPNI